MGLEMQIKKLTLFQNVILHFKSTEYKPRMQFEMKNVRNSVTSFHYTLLNHLHTFSLSDISEKKGMGYFHAETNSVPTEPYFCNYYLISYVFFLSRTNLITGLRLTRSVSIVIVVTVTTRTASSVSASLALQFFNMF